MDNFKLELDNLVQGAKDAAALYLSQTFPAEQIQPNEQYTKVDNSLRPVSFDTFIGQDDVKMQLKIAILSSIKRRAPLPHILLSGPAGTGKTTLAEIIASERGLKIKHALGISLKTPEDVFLTIQPFFNDPDYNILFIDEIHRLPKDVQEAFFTLMEDNVLTIKSVKSGKPVSIRLKVPITVIAGTTNPGRILKPLYSRFDNKVVLELYTPSQSAEIAKFAAERLGVSLTEEAAIEIAKRTHGTGREVTKYVKLGRDVAISLEKEDIDPEVIETAFKLYRVDENGLREKVEIKLLKYLANIYPNRIGANSLAEILDADREYLVSAVEPILINMGLVIRGSGGRTVTQKGLKYLQKNGHMTEKDIEIIKLKEETGLEF